MLCRQFLESLEQLLGKYDDLFLHFLDSNGWPDVLGRELAFTDASGRVPKN